MKLEKFMYSIDCICIDRKKDNFKEWRRKEVKITNLGSNKDFMHVIQLDLNKNEINRYKSLKEVNQSLGFNIASISKSCKEFPNKSFKGFLWKYNNDLNI